MNRDKKDYSLRFAVILHPMEPHRPGEVKRETQLFVYRKRTVLFPDGSVVVWREMWSK